MKRLTCFFTRTSYFILVILTSTAILAAQNRGPRYAPPADDGIFGSIWFYAVLVLIAGSVFIGIKLRRNRTSEPGHSNSDPVDGSFRMTYRERPTNKEAPAMREMVQNVPVPSGKKGFSSLPVASFVRLQRSNAYIQLYESLDPALLKAIEDVNEEAEGDVSARLQALRLLASFRTSNSVAAIAQMALYDLSSKIRSDAVQFLAEMDHESVFETIVTCCADPTREVRASAARALSKLTFDRAQAWTRIVESGDIARMRHAARSAVEGDLVTRYFERLNNTDRKIAYEAFALTALLVRSGETELIFRALADHRDEDVKLALLHIIHCMKEDRTSEWLEELLTKYNLTPSIASKVSEMRLQHQMAPV